MPGPAPHLQALPAGRPPPRLPYGDPSAAAWTASSALFGSFALPRAPRSTNSSSLAEALTARAGAVLAGGATHVARSYRPRIFVASAKGARKTLVDGRELVDYTMGHGALLLGHSHPLIVDAVCSQVEKGTHFGASHVLEIEWAELVARLVKSVQRVRFTSSGTEATMLALRLARAATGRELVAKVNDHFHGWHDALSVGLDAQGRVVKPAGVPRSTALLTRVIDPDKPESLERTLADRRVAALIVEPSGAHYGRTPLPEGWCAAARKACDATGTLLIFDEVVSGFRVRPGGMQELLGVTPDLSCFAKILGGGLPAGAVGGRADVMEQVAVNDKGAARVIHPGTFNANPLSAAAGIAMLDAAADGEPQRRASAVAAELEEIWRDRLRAAGVPGEAWRLESIVHASLDDIDAHRRLGPALREAGVDLLHTSAIVSAVHGDADLELTSTAIDTALRAVST